jgi:hypothetical protein
MFTRITCEVAENGDLCRLLPPHVKEIRLTGGEGFNKTIPPLPTTVVTLEFAAPLARDLEVHELPPWLKHLHMGREFRYIIKPGALPDSLETFTCFSLRTQELQPMIPRGLKRLELNGYHGSLQPGDLPPTLETLCLQSGNFAVLINPDYLPDGLLHLTVNNRFKSRGKLPQNLKTLTLTNGFCDIIRTDFLPDSLEKLIISSFLFQYRIEPGVLPRNLKELKITHEYPHAFEPGVLPESLESLTMGRNYKKQIRATALPLQLKYLKAPSDCLMPDCIRSIGGSVQISCHKNKNYANY